MATVDDDLLLDDEEEEEGYERRPIEEGEMDITPMIDITFLLLIFFIVCSKMQETADVELPIAKHGVPVASKDAIIFVIKEGSEDNAVVERGDGSAFSTDIQDQENEIIEYVEAGMAGTAPFTGQKHQVVVLAASKVKHREVSRVAKAIARAAEDLPSLHVGILQEQ